MFFHFKIKTRYDGPVEVSTTVKAKDAKREREAFGEVETKMLKLLKRDYGLTELAGNVRIIVIDPFPGFADTNFVPENEDCPIKSKIKLWIRLKREKGEIDELESLEAFRLSVILVSQLKISQEEQLVAHSIGKYAIT